MTLRSRARIFITPEIQARLERGDFTRAGGDARCGGCGEIYYDHPELVGGPGWIAIACDGRLLKL